MDSLVVVFFFFFLLFNILSQNNPLCIRSYIYFAQMCYLYLRLMTERPPKTLPEVES